jgi:hypothetical protein
VIKHIWFDFSQTIGTFNEEAHDKLRYESYASVVGKPVSRELIEEYKKIFTKYKNSNSAVFASLGLPAGYWSERLTSINPAGFFSLIDDEIPSIFETDYDFKNFEEILEIFK